VNSSYKKDFVRQKNLSPAKQHNIEKEADEIMRRIRDKNDFKLKQPTTTATDYVDVK
jgi:hypothetical protein